MQKIKHIVFDIGGVLLDWQLDTLLDFCFSKKEISDFRERLNIDHLPELLDRGNTYKDLCRDMALSEADAKIIKTLMENWNKGTIGPIEGTVALLNSLKVKTSYRLFAITNWALTTFLPTQEKFPFLKIFEDTVISGKERITKPDPRLYRILLERNCLKAEDCVFIDDRSINVEGAEAVGMKGICFRSASQLEADLAVLGVMIPS